MTIRALCKRKAYCIAQLQELLQYLPSSMCTVGRRRALNEKTTDTDKMCINAGRVGRDTMASLSVLLVCSLASMHQAITLFTIQESRDVDNA